jgi:hypothetical protein
MWTLITEGQTADAPGPYPARRLRTVHQLHPGKAVGQSPRSFTGTDTAPSWTASAQR